MNKNLYRGKRKDNSEWIEGYYAKAKDYLSEEEIQVIFSLDLTLFPHSEFSSYEEIIPETVGQFTGLYDKNGTKIFEGDIVHINGWWNASGPAGYFKNITVVEFVDDCCGFTPMCNYDCDCGVYHNASDCEVIGNIHDNPELLEVE